MGREATPPQEIAEAEGDRFLIVQRVAIHRLARGVSEGPRYATVPAAVDSRHGSPPTQSTRLSNAWAKRVDCACSAALPGDKVETGNGARQPASDTATATPHERRPA
jgi:hypothetical protein